VEGKEIEGGKESFVVFEEKRNLLRAIWEMENFGVVEMEVMRGGVK
jgi:REP element-mobilizing transposase RayT